MRLVAALSLAALLTATSLTPAVAQPIQVFVDAAHATGAYRPIWTFFGYDEPNYTYDDNGRALLHELATLTASPVYIRTHNLLTSGNGDGSLKWGSTNAYTEDAQGNPVYDWTIMDRIFDTYRDAGVRPLVQVGFMPEALSTHPEPYRHNFPAGPITTGWAYPPKDWNKWSHLVTAWATHLRDRYGAATVHDWKWEVWNEPDGSYWLATPADYNRLFDVTSAAIKAALPDAIVGGPHTTGPVVDHAADYLKQFLDHCAHGAVTPDDPKCSLDYVGFHAKGMPALVDGHSEMGIARQLKSVRRGIEITKSFPEFRDKPIIIGESDPEGCAACTPKMRPENAYRDGALYGAYVVETTHGIEELAAREQVHLEGAVTWAFQFENLPDFSGMRDLQTNGIDKGVLNAFRLMGMLGGERLAATSSGALDPASIVDDGVRRQPDIGVVATRREHQLAILIWNYHDDDIDVPPAPIDLAITNLPEDAATIFTEHFRMDATHSNAYALFKAMGEPEHPSPAQQAQLIEAGHLQLLDQPDYHLAQAGKLALHFDLPRYGVSLVRLTW
jgi:xylan 1,4-beta-xylosidase